MSPHETTRYALEVVRRLGCERYALPFIAVLTACGAAATPAQTPTTMAEPLPSGFNHPRQETPVETPVADQDAALVPPDQPSIAGVYLWCQAPAGRACRLASAALGTGPKDPAGLPPSLLTVQDRDDDCVEPTIASVSGRLERAFALPTGGWRDQGGNYLDLSLLGDMYQAAGCINDTDPTHPIAKISASDNAVPRVYLVRVWDQQSP